MYLSRCVRTDLLVKVVPVGPWAILFDLMVSF